MVRVILRIVGLRFVLIVANNFLVYYIKYGNNEIRAFWDSN